MLRFDPPQAVDEVATKQEVLHQCCNSAGHPRAFEPQEALIDADPARFFWPPYVGKNGWVGSVLDTVRIVGGGGSHLGVVTSVLPRI